MIDVLIVDCDVDGLTAKFDSSIGGSYEFMQTYDEHGDCWSTFDDDETGVAECTLRTLDDVYQFIATNEINRAYGSD